ncbi:MAG TPA: hypothetical protein VMR76_00850 [Candidatus Saccharimonadia bacterium]|nr:hypothetical protein [Candidatus Saccharimonadia bacterium]
MSRPKGSKNKQEIKPKELELNLEDRLDLISTLLIEIVCEELCLNK